MNVLDVEQRIRYTSIMEWTMEQDEIEAFNRMLFTDIHDGTIPEINKQFKLGESYKHDAFDIRLWSPSEDEVRFSIGLLLWPKHIKSLDCVFSVYVDGNCQKWKGTLLRDKRSGIVSNVLTSGLCDVLKDALVIEDNDDNKEEKDDKVINTKIIRFEVRIVNVIYMKSRKKVSGEYEIIEKTVDKIIWPKYGIVVYVYRAPYQDSSDSEWEQDASDDTM